MPGVIMENGSRNGLHTNHERDQRSNGVNGANQQLERVQDKGKGRAEPQQNVTPTTPNLPNGLNGTFEEASRERTSNGANKPAGAQARLNELPPEIAHITEGYLPLSELLKRLAQKTFNDMNTTIMELAEMPVPISATNGHASSSIEDNSQENIDKKMKLVNWATAAHANWIKQLAITEWSRKAGEISKLIDLQQHLRVEKQFYNQSIDTLCEYKRGLLGARLPNPDLRTALEILTTGKVSWMSDLGYVPPPPLSATQISKTLNTLDTLLSMRMNLHEHDNLPYHFRDYSISSGRITFKVAGEFEVDLAISSEDHEVQFWFIDFRFSFYPKPADMDPALRLSLEQTLNVVLLRDGLSGCYKYLHGIVLTRKILDIHRQAAELARGKWVDGLKTEQLNRSVVIQYWVNRYSKGMKSWIQLGVHSGKPNHGRHDPKATSRLSIRWFRDDKEVIDEEITFDTENLSAEKLLKAVIARHTSHILTTIHDKLLSPGLYLSKVAAIDLSTSQTEPTNAELRIELANALDLSVKIEPITGRFVFSPASQRVTEFEYKLNAQSKDPANDAHTYIEGLRNVWLQDDITRHAISVGWMRIHNPGFSAGVLQPIMPKETKQMTWFSRPNWVKNWYLVISFDRKDGDQWWLLQGENSTTKERKVTNKISIPINSASPIPTYNFMSSMNVYVAALLSGFSITKALHARRVIPVLREGKNVSRGITLPAIFARLSEILPSKNRSPRTNKPWAKDIVRITFQGLEVTPPALPSEHNNPSNPPIQTPDASAPVATGKQIMPVEESVFVVSEARMVVPLPKSITTINEMVDRNIAFQPETGAIAFKIKSRVGESIVNALVDRAIRVERLVDYVQVLQAHHLALKCESISLGKITFSYAVQDHEAATSKAASRCQAEIDFDDVEAIKLVLQTGDPLLRISDLLTMVLNDPAHGFNAVAKFLPITLPLLRGLNALESSWSVSSENGEGHCFILLRAVDWYIIRFEFSQPPPPGSDSLPIPRKATFEVRLKPRKGKPFWHIQRNDSRDGDDDLDVALKPVWNVSTEDWLGMRVSGVAEPFAIESLLAKLDKVVRDVALNPAQVLIAAPPAIVSTPVQAAAKAPSRPQMANHQRPPQGNQRPPPNQNQGRMNSSKVIEID